MTQARSASMRHFLAIEDQQQRRVVQLVDATYACGRDPSNSIVLTHESISRQHAILMRVPVSAMDIRYRILDGNLTGTPSLNGITVNGVRCSSHDLADGDEIVFAGVVTARYYRRPLSDQEFRDATELIVRRSIRLDPLDNVATVLRDP
ncbi:MAG: FHA domain-containing protein [Thermostichales cyanobacterium SZTDM-1c_bins_54]